MNFVITTFLVVSALSIATAYKEVLLVPQGKPFPGLKRGPKSEVIPSANSTQSARIVGGNYASPQQFPYHVGVLNRFDTNTYAWCGGTLLGHEWIITAAHCVTGALSIEIRLGSTNSERPLKKSSGLVVVFMAGHDGSLDYDIAMVKMQWVDYNANIAPASLPPLNGHHSLYVNEKVVASGWGGTDNKGGRGDQLKYFVTRAIEPKECGNAYGSLGSKPQTICTRVPKGAGGICSGDSGGPLVLENTWTLVGVASFGAAGACGEGWPDGFSRITFYLQWIKEGSGISY